MEIICLWLGLLFFYSHHFACLAAMALLWLSRPNWQMLLFALIGLLLGLGHQWLIAPEAMPQQAVAQTVQLVGHIQEAPRLQADKAQFVFQISQCNGQPARARILLNWYQHPPPLKLGQQWRLQAKIKRPRAYRNPGSTNYPLQLSARHLFWTGYVRQGKLLAEPESGWSIDGFRQQLGQGIAQRIADPEALGLVQALTLGMTEAISPALWDLFRHTGTTHLMVISGSHIAMLAGLALFLMQWLWTRNTRLANRWPALKAGSLFALLVSTGYTLLTGFQVPAQRSWLGSVLLCGRALGLYHASTWQVWRYALLGVLLIEPHACLSPGFYLSFLAVACLLIGQSRWQWAGWRSWLGLQLVCMVGLMPLTLYWFAYGSLTGLVANLLAIPFIGLIIVPWSMLVVTLAAVPGIDWFIAPLVWLIHLFLRGMRYLDQYSAFNLNLAIAHVDNVLLACAAMILGLVLPTRSFRLFGLLCLFLSFFPHRLKVPDGEALIRVLDVGQGLAVAIHTANHHLFYDLGDRFGPDQDLGRWVILPYLQDQGIQRLDRVVISHPDRDHAGGWQSLWAQIPVQALLTSDRRRAYPHQQATDLLNCQHVPPWTWDGVSFRFFPLGRQAKKNNQSCVLQVKTTGGRVLLTGDVERPAELALLHRYGPLLRADILLAPHHGSKTSSSWQFVHQVKPHYAIASLGFDNRFHFPHPSVSALYQELGVPLLRTDTLGMVSMRLMGDRVVFEN